MLEHLLDHCTQEAADSDDRDAGVVNCFSKPSEVEEASAASPIAVTTVINMLRSARRRREFVYQIKPPSYNI